MATQNTPADPNTEAKLRSSQRLMKPWERAVIGTYLVLVSLLLMCMVAELWRIDWEAEKAAQAAAKADADRRDAKTPPAASQGDQKDTAAPEQTGVQSAGTTPAPAKPEVKEQKAEPQPSAKVNFFGMKPINVNRELQLFMLVICAGALGSTLHALRSFADFGGNRQLYASWLFWYFQKPANGALLAFVVYAMIRGGFLTGVTGDTDKLSVYGFAGFSALVGLFSDRALLKLKEVFGTMFALIDHKNERADPLATPEEAPTLHAATPSQIKQGSANAFVELRGRNLRAKGKAYVDGQMRPATLGDDGSLRVELTDADVASVGTRSIHVANPDGQRSATITLEIVA